MTWTLAELGGQRALLCHPEAPVIATRREAGDLIGEALGAGASLVVVPKTRLPAEFFRLASGLAGEVLQAFVNYRIGVAIIGDLGEELAGSAPLRDFVREANRGREVRFAADLEALRSAFGAD
ncbi:MAG: DUF4180 domain-containing protein [Phenylobacterium sp.]|uniref:DUF4180 domain-containing protein n=1 Tax=Phenylobacterium sp. TaxID=1871053 RepID=UPI0039191DBA